MEDRTDDNLQAFMDENRHICLLHNMDYLFLEKSSFHVPPYWGKIFELQKIMNEHPDVDYIMWLDSDAFFINYDDEKFQRFLQAYEPYSMIFTTDMPPIQNDAFNAGSFLIKNDENGRNLVKKWTSHYRPDKWQYKNEKWATESIWAGEDYEQGAFVKHIIPNPEFNKNIIQLSYKYLNNHNCEDNLDEVITTHLAGERKTDNPRVQKCLQLFKTKKNCMVEGFDTISSFAPRNDSIYYFCVIFLLILIGIWFYFFTNMQNGWKWVSLRFLPNKRRLIQKAIH
jgi:hypothetical protein